jgi:hypothetical protein
MNRALLLLADPSPHLRRLVLRDLLARQLDDPEVAELEALCAGDPLLTGLLALQGSDGAWRGSPRGGWGANPLMNTTLALLRLGWLGYDAAYPAVRRGAEYLFSLQREDGAWPPPGEEPGEEEEEDPAQDGYASRPLQTALPLRALAACGFAADPRAERGYRWLLAQRLPDGAWPTGITRGGGYGYVAGYRRMAHSRWGCRSNTTGALLCLAAHPRYYAGPEARRALDLLLGRETREVENVGFELARLLGAEPARGFITFYGRFDLALLLDLCSRTGASREDERVRDLVRFVTGLQGEYGLWEYRRQPQVSRWLTFDLLRSLTRLAGAGEDCISFEPRTPFQPYPKKEKRF